jgi:general secretion pathway protein D
MRLLLLAVLAGVLWGPVSIEAATRVYRLGEADPAEVEAVVRSMVPEGTKIIPMPNTGKLYVEGEPALLDRIEEVVRAMDVPRANVRIDVKFAENGVVDSSGLGVQARVDVPPVRIRTGPSGSTGSGATVRRGDSVVINAHNTRTTTQSNSGMFLVARSGTPASLTVAREVPFPEYFIHYVVRNGLWTGAVGITRPEWKSIGTRLSFIPEVRGDLITVTILPEITALESVSSPGSGGGWRPTVIQVRSLSTQVTVRNGAEITLGGLNGADEEFHRNFFSSVDRTGTVGSSQFTLRASVLAP